MNGYEEEEDAVTSRWMRGK